MSQTTLNTSRAKLGEARAEFALRMGDNGLILSHRLAQWSGCAHSLEEDIALTNIGLDLLGQARAWLTLAGEIEGKGRDEDDLAYFRDGTEFRNFTLVEQPNGDFAHTIMRQFLFDTYQGCLLSRLQDSSDPDFAPLAQKSHKETAYHLRHSSTWIGWLAGGTKESLQRLEAGLLDCWPYCDSMFWPDETSDLLAGHGLVPEVETLRQSWTGQVEAVFAAAGLRTPLLVDKPGAWAGQLGCHSENLGHILAELQVLPRQHPNAKW